MANDVQSRMCVNSPDLGQIYGLPFHPCNPIVQRREKQVPFFQAAIVVVTRRLDALVFQEGIHLAISIAKVSSFVLPGCSRLQKAP